MEKQFLAFLTTVMTVTIAIEDVPKLRFHECADGDVTIWDYDSSLGHLMSYVTPDQCAENKMTIEELVDWLKDNNAKSRPQVPAHF